MAFMGIVNPLISMASVLQLHVSYAFTFLCRKKESRLVGRLLKACNLSETTTSTMGPELGSVIS